MLDRGEHDAGAHQRRGVATVRNRFDVSRNLEPAEIGSQKNVSGVGRRREKSHLDRNGCMQANAFRFHRTREGRLLCVG